MVSLAIVDYDLGNLFSIEQASRHAGLDTVVTADPGKLASADAVLLPGVGAFVDAMAALQARDLVAPLRGLAAAGKPLIGICLGQQLLMTESREFGSHAGLGLIDGTVERLPEHAGLKVPQVGWRPIAPAGGDWDDGTYRSIAPGTHMYFVHSYYVRPDDSSVIQARARFGDLEFCAGLRRGNILACQFHPERSAAAGLQWYKNLAAILESGTLARGEPT